DHSGRGIEGRATPLCTTIKTGKDDCLAPEFERHELPRASKCSKLVDSPPMRLRRPHRQHLLGEQLAGKGSRPGWERLRLGRDLAFHCARRHAARLDWEQRRSV